MKKNDFRFLNNQFNIKTAIVILLLAFLINFGVYKVIRNNIYPQEDKHKRLKLNSESITDNSKDLYKNIKHVHKKINANNGILDSASVIFIRKELFDLEKDIELLQTDISNLSDSILVINN